MAEDKDQGEKTEEATPQRREEFRKQGQVAMTRELGPALLFFGAALMIWLLSRFVTEQFVVILREGLSTYVVTYGKTGEFLPLAKFATLHSIFILGPVFLFTGVLAFLATTLQVGFLTSTEAVEPKIEKVDPVAGFQRIFSLRSLVEGLKSLVKVSVVGAITYVIIYDEMRTLPHLMDLSIEQMVQYVISITMHLLFAIGLAMVAIAILDYAYNWWDLEQRMMMTKQEIKEELKNREGNPQIKARIRKIQRDIATKRMMEAIPKADVIITNPTHIAIALKYDANLPAPQIIAKGADLVAEKIKEIARKHNIPIVENKPLARTIFKTLKIGQVIPRELFHAVAEVLAYVYKLKKRLVT